MDSIKSSPQFVPLAQIVNDKGAVYHALKMSEAHFQGFGEAYFSKVNKGVIKGWKRHSKMVCNLIVPEGAVLFRIITKENERLSCLINHQQYGRLCIPPGNWFSFEGIEENNLILNIANIQHDPEEAENLPLSAFDLASYTNMI